jgi:hypothetical protein
LSFYVLLLCPSSSPLHCSPCSHSRPFSAKWYRGTDTHNMHSLIDAVDGRGQGLGLAKECATHLNCLWSTMTTLISWIQSLATMASSATQLWCSWRISNQRDNASPMRFRAPRLCLTSQSTIWGTIWISICCIVRCCCMRIKCKIPGSMYTTNYSLALCRFNVQYNQVPRIPNCSNLYTGYHVFALCSIQPK